MIDVSNNLRNVYNQSTRQIDRIKINNDYYYIRNVEYSDDCYEDGNIFGTAIARIITFEIDSSIGMEKKEFQYETGVMIGNTPVFISLGNFIVTDTEEGDTTEITKVTAMDYMLKTNIKYNSNLNYSSATILDVLVEVCTNCGLSLATTTFTNSTFRVDSNQFDDSTLCRQVIQAIAQISGTVAKIKNDNRLYLINPNQVTDVSQVFTLKEYSEADIKRLTHPLNLVSLASSQIEGENITLRDEDSISIDGQNSLIINDNPFAYNQDKRTQLITPLFNAVKGFEYKSYSFKFQMLPYIETLDKIQFLDKNGNTYNSYVFRFNYKSPNGLDSTIEAPSLTRATINYQNIPNALEVAKRTEIIVDKQNQTIESVVSNVNSQNNKISQLTQTVDELNSRISDIADITTSGESMQASVQLSNINQSEPIELIVHPITQSISYLYPRNNLYPSSDLYLTTRTIRFVRTYDDNGTTRTQNIDYILPDDLLYYDSENYDEFILNYDSHTCQVRKKCKYNADGTVGLLSSEVVTDYTYPTIQLEDGDYQIKILNYNIGYLSVRLMAQNIYTTQFATKAEVTSEINQKADSITASVNQTFSNYSTTNQMNSAIQLKANEITSSVSETYATKTALNTVNSNLSSQITQTANQITSSVSNTYATKNQLNNYSTTTQMNSAINQKADSITSTVSSTYETKTNASNTYATKTQLNTAKSEIRQTTDSISATVSNNNTKANIIAKINNNTSSAKINADVISLSANDILNLLAGNTINLSSKNINIQSNNFKVSTDGILECWEAIFRNAKLMGGDLNFYKANGDLVGRIRRATSSFDGTSAEALVLSTLQSTTPTFFIYFHNSSGDLTGPPILSISQKSTSNFDNLSSSSGYVGFIEIRQVVQVSNLIVNTIQPYSGNTVNVSGYVRATGFVNNSKESLKKDIEKYNDIALEIIKESEIYQYHFQKEDDTDKKHLGFVIGDLGGEYKTPDEVLSQDGEGIDTYNMTSILWKAFQEYIEKTDAKIAQLEQEIKELKGEK